MFVGRDVDAGGISLISRLKIASAAGERLGGARGRPFGSRVFSGLLPGFPASSYRL